MLEEGWDRDDSYHRLAKESPCQPNWISSDTLRSASQTEANGDAIVGEGYSPVVDNPIG